MFQIPNQKRETLKKLFIVFLVFAILFVFALNYHSFISVWNMYNYDKYLASLKQLKDEKGLSALYEINNDFVGYIECDDLEIYLPIVKSNAEDKEYYLHHDFKKDDNELGCPFQKYGTELGTTTNTTLVGHSAYTETIFSFTNNVSIFGNFEKYLRYDSNFEYKIKVETFEKTYEYKVISVMCFHVDEYNTLKYSVADNASNITTQEKFDEYYKIIKDNNLINTLEGAEFGDKFLTIFTCLVTNLDYRVMVVAKQIN